MNTQYEKLIDDIRQVRWDNIKTENGHIYDLAVQDIIKMINKKYMKTFQEYLREEHARNYMGTDDNMPEAFEKWLSYLSIDEWLVHGNGFGIFIIKECTKAVNNI